MNENELVDWLGHRIAKFGQSRVGVGDDAAVLPSNTQDWVVTSDMLMDGVDFSVHDHTPELIGRKAIAVNLSDIAAMACEPTTALISVAIPKSLGRDWTQRLAEGMLQTCREFGVELVGGDTNSWINPLVISVTMHGRVLAGRTPVLRSGAQAGDRILVTGPLGGSIFGRHLDFVPRVALGQWLATHADVHAMMDLSDGIASDLPRICAASNLGARVVGDRLPIHMDVRSRFAKESWIPHALCDGEDFELLICCSQAEARRLGNLQPFGVEFVDIGEITAQRGIDLDIGGSIQPLAVKGFIHDW